MCTLVSIYALPVRIYMLMPKFLFVFCCLFIWHIRLWGEDQEKWADGRGKLWPNCALQASLESPPPPPGSLPSHVLDISLLYPHPFAMYTFLYHPAPPPLFKFCIFISASILLHTKFIKPYIHSTSYQLCPTLPLYFQYIFLKLSWDIGPS